MIKYSLIFLCLLNSSSLLRGKQGVFSEREIVAATLILEAGGQRDGRSLQAIYEVICNRASIRHKTQKEVVLEPKQFSCFNSGNIQNKVKYAQKHKKYEKAFRIVVNNQKSNFTNNANHYWADSIKRPKWSEGRIITKIGNHLFIKL